MKHRNHSLAAGIQKVGFRKWYERELLSSHAHMVLAFLCVVGLMAALEVFKGGTVADKLFDAAAILVCAGVGLWALRRYLALLMHAEHIANQAHCPHCATYGLLTLISEDASRQKTLVRCRKCAHEWTIEA